MDHSRPAVLAAKPAAQNHQPQPPTNLSPPVPTSGSSQQRQRLS